MCIRDSRIALWLVGTLYAASLRSAPLLQRLYVATVNNRSLPTIFNIGTNGRHCSTAIYVSTLLHFQRNSTSPWTERNTSTIWTGGVANERQHGHQRTSFFNGFILLTNMVINNQRLFRCRRQRLSVWLSPTRSGRTSSVLTSTTSSEWWAFHSSLEASLVG